MESDRYLDQHRYQQPGEHRFQHPEQHLYGHPDQYRLPQHPDQHRLQHPALHGYQHHEQHLYQPLPFKTLDRYPEQRHDQPHGQPHEQPHDQQSSHHPVNQPDQHPVNQPDQHSVKQPDQPYHHSVNQHSEKQPDQQHSEQLTGQNLDGHSSQQVGQHSVRSPGQPPGQHLNGQPSQPLDQHNDKHQHLDQQPKHQPDQPMKTQQKKSFSIAELVEKATPQFVKANSELLKKINEARQKKMLLLKEREAEENESDSSDTESSGSDSEPDENTENDNSMSSESMKSNKTQAPKKVKVMPRIGKLKDKELVECRGCHKQLRSLMCHLSKMPKCRLSYDMESVENEKTNEIKEFETCKGCHEQFRSLLSHLRKRPNCQSEYDMDLLLAQAKKKYTETARLKYHQVKNQKKEEKKKKKSDVTTGGFDHYNKMFSKIMEKPLEVGMNEVDKNAFQMLYNNPKLLKGAPEEDQKSGEAESLTVECDVGIKMEEDASPSKDDESHEGEALTVECEVDINYAMHSDDDDGEASNMTTEGDPGPADGEMGENFTMSDGNQDGMLPPGMHFPPGLFFNSTNSNEENTPFIGLPTTALYTRTYSDIGRDFSCNVCGKSFKGKRDCIRHVRSHNKEKPFSCKICGRSFGRECYLRVHEKIHTGEKPFKCSMCQWAFARKATLEQHMLTHSDVKERPFQCHLCSNGYVKSSHLNRHIKTHLGIHEFFCNICHESFLEKRGLVSHMKRLHSGARPYPCSICRQEFRKEYILRKHMLNAHDYVLPKDAVIEKLPPLPSDKQSDDKDAASSDNDPSSDKEPDASDDTPSIMTPGSHSLFGGVSNLNNNLGKSGAKDSFFENFVKNIDKNINTPLSKIKIPKIEKPDEEIDKSENSNDVSSTIKKELMSDDENNESTPEKKNGDKNMDEFAKAYINAASPNKSKKKVKKDIPEKPKKVVKKDKVPGLDYMVKFVKANKSFEKKKDKKHDKEAMAKFVKANSELIKKINKAKQEKMKLYNERQSSANDSESSDDSHEEMDTHEEVERKEEKSPDVADGSSNLQSAIKNFYDIDEDEDLYNASKGINSVGTSDKVVSPNTSENRIEMAEDNYSYQDNVVSPNKSENSVETAKVDYSYQESYENQNVAAAGGHAEVPSHTESFANAHWPKEGPSEVGYDKQYNYADRFGRTVSPYGSQNDIAPARIYSYPQGYGSSEVSPYGSQNEVDPARVYSYPGSYGSAAGVPNPNDLSADKVYDYSQSYARYDNMNQSYNGNNIDRVYDYSQNVNNSTSAPGTATELSSVSNILTMCLGNVSQDFQYLDN